MKPDDTTAPRGLVDLAAAEVGGRALLASDEFFAGKENLLAAGRGVWKEGLYTEHGKWMDGWESRRRRTPGHDWCIIQLGLVGEISVVDICTDHFTGNYPPFAELEACHAPGATAEALRDEVSWTRIVRQVALKGGRQNLAVVDVPGRWTHVRLRIFPAGGVARLRCYGTPSMPAEDPHIDLVAMINGGRTLAASDMYFSDMANLIRPGQATDMGQGWETRRSRPPGEDWILLQLGHAGHIDDIEVDTLHFKGNYPDSFVLEALHWLDAPPHDLTRTDAWTPIAEGRLKAHEAHTFPVSDAGPWTHLRLRIRPDGGVSRLRVWGRPDDTAPDHDDPLIVLVNGPEASIHLGRCCGAHRWVAAMAGGAPYQSRTQLFGEAEARWWRLDESDWREAFTHHPRIGADVAKLREKFASTAGWSAGEQAGMASADEAVIQALAAGNQAYEERYGFIFIVCASGLSAAEMLARLNDRMDNDPEAELRIAAGEQAKITRLRLEKLT